MLSRFDNISYLFGGLPAGRPSSVPLFSDSTIEFLSLWSNNLLAAPETRGFPDIATFAFFCRKSNLIRLRERHSHQVGFRRGRGLVLHIAPSNVPVNFAYSLICGLLAGNYNLVRVPSRPFAQVELLVAGLKAVPSDPRMDEVKSRITLVRYDKNSGVTAQFSRLCQARVIWGGDSTVQDIRALPAAPRCVDVTFPDRYSACLIDAAAYLACSHRDRLAEGFYNDTYLWDQGACTAPHLVIWRGTPECVAEAKDVFWSSLGTLVRQRYPATDGATAISKLTTFCLTAAHEAEARGGPVLDNRLWRVDTGGIPPSPEQYRCLGGYFTECSIQSLDELISKVGENFQTLSYFGISRRDLESFVAAPGLSGLDRVVPIGRTLDFSLTWDGFDFISTLSRCIEVL